MPPTHSFGSNACRKGGSYSADELIYPLPPYLPTLLLYEPHYASSSHNEPLNTRGIWANPLESVLPDLPTSGRTGPLCLGQGVEESVKELVGFNSHTGNRRASDQGPDSGQCLRSRFHTEKVN